MISYTIIEVSEVAGEATKDEVRYNWYHPIYYTNIKRLNY